MPASLVSLYAEELPRIAAIESMQRSQEVAVGSATLGKNDRRATIRGWKSAMRNHSEQKRRSMNREETTAMLGAMGIGVEWRSD